jgi:hypothetical protein
MPAPQCARGRNEQVRDRAVGAPVAPRNQDQPQHTGLVSALNAGIGNPMNAAFPVRGKNAVSAVPS